MSDYSEGFRDGWSACEEKWAPTAGLAFGRTRQHRESEEAMAKPKPKRKLSAWNRFVKANSKKPRFIFKSNTATHKKGQLNLKKMGVAFHKTPEGKASKKKRR